MNDGPGVHNPRCIDPITQTKNGEVVLVMAEIRTWDGSLERLAELQDKINAYLSFALDGANEPDPVSLEALDAIRQQISPIPMVVEVL